MSKKDKKKSKVPGYKPEDVLFHVYQTASRHSGDQLSRKQFEALYETYSKSYLDETTVKEDMEVSNGKADAISNVIPMPVAVSDDMTRDVQADVDAISNDVLPVDAEETEGNAQSGKEKKKAKKAKKKAEKAAAKKAKKAEKKQKKALKKAKKAGSDGENTSDDLWDSAEAAVFYAEQMATQQIEKNLSSAADLLTEPDMLNTLLDQVDEHLHSLETMMLNLRLKTGYEMAKEKVEAAVKVVETAPSMVELMRNYTHGGYARAGVESMKYIVAALLYLESDDDLLPDTIPGIGYLDDLSVLKIAESVAAEDLAAFAAWKEVPDGGV